MKIQLNLQKKKTAMDKKKDEITKG